MTRIEQLKQFIVDDPADAFPRYALALEYLKTEPSLARRQFDELLQQFPDYLPTYYPAAHLLVELGDVTGAERLFQRGIEIAQRQANRKTEMELRQAYNQWQFERS
jgi:Tfp pilus assembly protein PilF